MDKVNDWLSDHLPSYFKDYLRNHPYGPNSSPGNLTGRALGGICSTTLLFSCLRSLVRRRKVIKVAIKYAKERNRTYDA